MGLGADSKGGGLFLNVYSLNFCLYYCWILWNNSDKYFFESGIKHKDKPLQPPLSHMIWLLEQPKHANNHKEQQIQLTNRNFKIILL